ncbi:MAG: DUF4157 domain-containing protein [Anaerolineae bacterium]|nr:DUF4157 domain-containing protein [Anaerolineae bacterium]
MVNEDADLLALQRAITDLGQARPTDVIALQRVAGNRAVSRMIQAQSLVLRKLTVGAANDHYEQEADRVAEQVLSVPTPATQPVTGGSVQRQPEEEEEIQTKPLAVSITPLVQRQGEEEEIQTSRLQRKGEEEEIQTKSLVLLQRQGEEEEIQTKPLVQRRGDGSFDAGSEVEQRLAAQKGGGEPLAGNVRSFMEPRFGADFSGVRVHTGGEAADLNRSLRAQAFTHGSDIYLGAGSADLGTTAGKQLLAHELAHTIQQGATRVQPRPAANVAAATSTIADGTLQRKTGWVREKTHARIGPAAFPATATSKQKQKLVEGGGMAQEFEPLSQAEIDDNDALHIMDTDGKNVVWYRLEVKPPKQGANQYIRATKVFLSDPDTQRDLKKQARKTAGEAAETKAEEYDTYKGAVEALGLPTDLLGLDEATTGSQALAGAIGATSGLLGCALALRKLLTVRAAESRTEGVFQAIEGSLEMAQGVTSTGSGISGAIVAGTGAEAKPLAEAATAGEKAAAAGAFFESFTGGLKALLGVVNVIHDGVKMVGMVMDDKKYSGHEYGALGGKLLQDVLDTATGVVSSAKNVFSLVTEIPTGLEQAVPGLDIGVSAVKIVMEGLYAIEAAVHHYRMSRVKASLEQEAVAKQETMLRGQTQGPLPEKAAETKVGETRGFYQKQEAIVANNANLKKQAEAEKKLLQDKMAKITGADPKSAQQRNALNAKITAQDGKITRYDQAAKDAEAAMKARDDAQGAAKDSLSREELGELELAMELGSGTGKRIVRQLIHIGNEIVKIGAAITQLVAGATGVGAAVAVALKTGTALVDLSLPFFRFMKQYARNKAAEEAASGKAPGMMTRVFKPVAEKSTAAKLAARKKRAIKILELVASLPVPKSIPGSRNWRFELVEFDAKGKRVEEFILAAGVSPEKLYSLNGDPGGQVKLLADAMAKREFEAA